MSFRPLKEPQLEIMMRGETNIPKEYLTNDGHNKMNYNKSNSYENELQQLELYRDYLKESGICVMDNPACFEKGSNNKEGGIFSSQVQFDSVNVHELSPPPSLTSSSPASSNSEIVDPSQHHEQSEPKFSSGLSIDMTSHEDISSNVECIDTPNRHSNYNSNLNSSTTQSTNKRLTFLETLEAVPRESDILSLKRVANTINLNTNNPSVLFPAFSNFTKHIQDISKRANYWSWAPNYMTFLILFVRGEFGAVTNDTIVQYVIQLFCLFSCHVCKFDLDREPAIYNYFVNFFIPQLISHIGEYESDEGFDSTTLALSYIFYKIPVNEAIIDIVRNLRLDNMELFYTPAFTNIRYQRALWLSSITYQLVLCIKRGEDVAECKSNILKCYDEALVSNEHEKNTKISKVYERFFDLKSQNFPKRMFNTDYFLYSNDIEKFPLLIANFMGQVMSKGKQQLLQQQQVEADEKPKKMFSKFKKIFRS